MKLRRHLRSTLHPLLAYPLRTALALSGIAASGAITLDGNGVGAAIVVQYVTSTTRAVIESSFLAPTVISAGGAILDNRLKVVQIKPDQQARWRLRRKLARAGVDPGAAFACVQSLDRAADPEREAILRWLDRSIGRPADVLAG